MSSKFSGSATEFLTYCESLRQQETNNSQCQCVGHKNNVDCDVCPEFQNCISE